MVRKLLALFALSMMLGTGEPSLADTITFGGAPVGAAPADFDVERTGQGGPARWNIVRDETAQDGLAVEQVSQEWTDYRFPLAIYKPSSGANADIQIRLKPVSGKVDRSAGIAVRFTGPDNYYVVRANALEDNVRFYRVVKGKREELKSANTKVTSNEWHTLGLKAEGDRFTVSFDGKHFNRLVPEQTTIIDVELGGRKRGD